METQDDFISFEPDEPEPIVDIESSDEGEIVQENILIHIKTPEWVPDNRKYSDDMITRLDQEIFDFTAFIRPTEGEIQMRKFTLGRLKTVVQSLFLKSEIYCFGSFAYDLYLPHSDLDVVVVSNDAFVPNCLRSLEQGLINYSIGKDIVVISGSKVPIVKYTDTISNFQLDVSFNTINGVEAVGVVQKMLNVPFIGQAARSLMYILKQFLMQRNLNEVFSGGIGSYSLLCMIISFLRMHPKIQTRSINPMKNLGILLIEFLELYGRNFNYNNVGLEVSPTICRYFPRKDLRERRPPILFIRDPQDPNNNVSAGSYNFMQVKWSFSKAYTTLTAMIGAGYEAKVRRNFGILRPRKYQIISMLGNIIQINREVLEQREYVQIQYENYMNGSLEDDAFGSTTISIPETKKINHKRKRDDENTEIIYLDSSDLESEESTKTDIKKLTKKIKKKSRSNVKSVVEYAI